MTDLDYDRRNALLRAIKHLERQPRWVLRRSGMDKLIARTKQRLDHLGAERAGDDLTACDESG